MLAFLKEDTGIELHITKHPYEDFGEDNVARVVEGINNEDMRIVSVEDIARSYAAIGAFDLTESGEKKIVGFARQIQPDLVITSAGRLFTTEVGSVWVDPKFRGRGIGNVLIRHTTDLITTVGYIPLAVCNQYSRTNFESAGYSPVGIMPSTREGNERVVEVFEKLSERNIKGLEQYGLRSEILHGISQLPRFDGLVLSD